MDAPNLKGMKEDKKHGDELLPIVAYSFPGNVLQREESVKQDPHSTWDRSSVECHWHNEMELFLVKRGVMTIQCGNTLFEAREGDIAFFNSGELHAAVPADGNSQMYFDAIVFSPDYLCGVTEDILRVKYITPVVNGELQLPRLIQRSNSQYNEIYAYFKALYEILTNRSPLFEFHAKIAALQLFSCLVQQAETVGTTMRSGAAASNVKKAIRYIHENYKNQLNIDRLAEIAGMSEGHFCRVFKQYTLKTPVQFINSVRLSHAAEQLSGSNKRVLDIAMDCGFNSVSYFIEVFRENFGTTPSKYRKS